MLWLTKERDLSKLEPILKPRHTKYGVFLQHYWVNPDKVAASQSLIETTVKQFVDEVVNWMETDEEFKDWLKNPERESSARVWFFTGYAARPILAAREFEDTDEMLMALHSALKGVGEKVIPIIEAQIKRGGANTYDVEKFFHEVVRNYVIVLRRNEGKRVPAEVKEREAIAGALIIAEAFKDWSKKVKDGELKKVFAGCSLSLYAYALTLLTLNPHVSKVQAVNEVAQHLQREGFPAHLLKPQEGSIMEYMKGIHYTDLYYLFAPLTRWVTVPFPYQAIKTFLAAFAMALLGKLGVLTPLQSWDEVKALWQVFDPTLSLLDNDRTSLVPDAHIVASTVLAHYFVSGDQNFIKDYITNLKNKLGSHLLIIALDDVTPFLNEFAYFFSNLVRRHRILPDEGDFVTLYLLYHKLPSNHPLKSKVKDMLVFVSLLNDNPLLRDVREVKEAVANEVLPPPPEPKQYPPLMVEITRIYHLDEWEAITKKVREQTSRWMNTMGDSIYEWATGKQRESGERWEDYVGAIKDGVVSWHTRTLMDDDNFMDALYDSFVVLSDKEPSDIFRLRQLVYDLIDGFVGQWAKTSSDEHPLAYAIQIAIAQEFGLRKNYEKLVTMLRWVEENKNIPDFSKRVAWVYNRLKPLLHAFVRSVYEHTQKVLRESGLEEIWLIRGLTLREGIKVKRYFDRFKHTALPASSWTTDKRTALGFALSKDEGEIGVLFTTKVKKDQFERVLSTPVSGFGCFGEAEFVLLGINDDDGLLAAQVDYE